MVLSSNISSDTHLYTPWDLEQNSSLMSRNEKSSILRNKWPDKSKHKSPFFFNNNYKVEVSFFPGFCFWVKFFTTAFASLKISGFKGTLYELYCPYFSSQVRVKSEIGIRTHFSRLTETGSHLIMYIKFSGHILSNKAMQ